MRAAIRGLASTVSPAVLVSHVSLEVFTNRSAITLTVAARVRAAIRGLASTASLAPLVSHASLEACTSRGTIA